MEAFVKNGLGLFLCLQLFFAIKKLLTPEIHLTGPIFKNCILIWEKTHRISITKDFMLFRGTITNNSENHIKHINTLWGQYPEIVNKAFTVL
jgi:hypothetical protein